MLRISKRKIINSSSKYDFYRSMNLNEIIRCNIFGCFLKPTRLPTTSPLCWFPAAQIFFTASYYQIYFLIRSLWFFLLFLTTLWLNNSHLLSLLFLLHSKWIHLFFKSTLHSCSLWVWEPSCNSIPQAN